MCEEYAMGSVDDVDDVDDDDADNNAVRANRRRDAAPGARLGLLEGSAGKKGMEMEGFVTVFYASLLMDRGFIRKVSCRIRRHARQSEATFGMGKSEGSSVRVWADCRGITLS